MGARPWSFFVVAVAGVHSLALAGPPTFHVNSCPVRVDSQRLGTDMTPQGASLRNTVAYEPSTGVYHFWGFLADDPSFPSPASTLTAVKHATSTDGIHFTSDRNLVYEIGSANWADFGVTADPPLDFFRALYDGDTGTWKLFNWTENIGAAAGSYNYNTSVNDLGAVASNTSVVHQGPLNSPFSGNHVGAFGLVDGTLYLRVDSLTGGNGEFAYTDGMHPSTGNLIAEADLYSGTPYCWELTATQPASGNDPPVCPDTSLLPAYVHNVGRTLRQPDSSIGTYYDFRVCTSAFCGSSVRADKNLWYIESDDNGATWSTPAKVFADGAAITIDEQPLDSDTGGGNFSNVDVINAVSAQRIYFSTQDAAGNYVFVTAASMAADTIFAEAFEGCGD